MSGPQLRFAEGEAHNADTLIALALAEDLAHIGDITCAAIIPSQARGRAQFVARSPGVLAGLPVAGLLARHFHLDSEWKPYRVDGEKLDRGDVIAEIAGPLRSILALERTALNFLQRLSGIATLTARFVAAIEGTRSAILDTRKTTPAWRVLEKYAVRCGGGQNHRMGLYDAVLIKDNHLAYLHSQSGPDSIAAAVAAARAHAPRAAFIEVEVDSLEQLDRALLSDADLILVDNLDPEVLAEAVRRRDAIAPRIKLEASGGVSLVTVRELARTGVERISVGALTHSAPALDIALDLEKAPA
jgi:nicotinate-nucleotide pyrophosphorylase (carboxylating)